MSDSNRVPPVNARDFLYEAEATQHGRADEYDQPDGERSMEAIVGAFNALFDQNLTVSQGWHFMCLLKKRRGHIAQKFHEDSCVDDVSYASLAAEALRIEKSD